MIDLTKRIWYIIIIKIVMIHNHSKKQTFFKKQKSIFKTKGEENEQETFDRKLHNSFTHALQDSIQGFSKLRSNKTSNETFILLKN